MIIILVIVVLLHFSLTVYVKGGTGGEFVIKVKYLGITLYPRKKKPKKEKKKKDEEDFDDELFDELNDDSEDDDEDDIPEDISEDKPAVTIEETLEETDTDEDDESEQEEKVEEQAEETSDKKKSKKKKEKKSKKEDESDDEKKEGKLEGLKRKWEFIKPYIPPAWKYTKKLLKAIRIENVKINIDTGKEDAADSATFYGKLQTALFNTLNVLSMIFTVKVKEANVRCLFNVKKLDAEGEAVIRVRPSTVIAIAVCLLWCWGKLFIPYKLRQRRARKKAEKEAKKRAKSEASAEPA